MIKRLLSPLAFLYGAGVQIRHKLFDWGIVKSAEFDIPVVCVGNITVGGTGKTPVAEFLIDNLKDDFNIAVLSRGYRRRTKGYVEARCDSSFLSVGDEPKQMKLKFPDIVVAVCEKRAQGIDMIRKAHPQINLIILDDAFQHRYVEPWINIVLMDFGRPIYNDKLLPVGSLRDLPSQMHRADIVVVTKCDSHITDLDKRLVRKGLKLFPYQSLYFTSIREQALSPIFPENVVRNIESGAPIIVMAGIGNPQPFINSLSHRYEVVDTLIFRDHHPYRMRDLDKMKKALEQAPRGTIIVTTEKDAVKLTSRKRIPQQIQEALYYIPIEISFADESSEQDFLRKLNIYVRTNQKYCVLHS